MTFDEVKALIDYTLTKIEGGIWTIIIIVVFVLIGLGMANSKRK